MMKRIWRYFVTLSVCVVLLLLNGAQAFACTGVYVGAGVSEDGTVLLAKSNDYQAVWQTTSLLRSAWRAIPRPTRCSTS